MLHFEWITNSASPPPSKVLTELDRFVSRAVECGVCWPALVTAVVPAYASVASWAVVDAVRKGIDPCLMVREVALLYVKAIAMQQRVSGRGEHYAEAQVIEAQEDFADECRGLVRSLYRCVSSCG